MSQPAVKDRPNPGRAGRTGHEDDLATRVSMETLYDAGEFRRTCPYTREDILARPFEADDWARQPT